MAARAGQKVIGVPKTVKFPVIGSNPPWGITIPRQEVEGVIRKTAGTDATWKPCANLPAAIPCLDGLLFVMSYTRAGETEEAFSVSFYKMGERDLQAGSSSGKWNRTGRRTVTMDEAIEGMRHLDGARKES